MRNARAASLRRVSVAASILGLALVSLGGAGCASSEGGAAGRGDEKPVVARVTPISTGEEAADLAAQFDVWEAHPSEGYLVAYLARAEIDPLSARGYVVEVDAEWTERVNRPPEILLGSAGGIPGYPCYRTVEETVASLNGLVSGYPTLATKTDIGDSWEKTTGASTGFDLWDLTLTNSAVPGPKPRFLLVAETHPREYVTAEVAIRFAESLLSSYSVDPDTTWLLDLFELHLVAMANPDGRKIAEQGHYWRKNADLDECPPTRYGVDLNRNYDFEWGGAGSSSDPCNETYHGPDAGSEPETRALQDHIARLFPDRRGPNANDPAPSDTEGIYVTLHSYGQLVLWPWSWSSDPAPNATALQTLGRKLAFQNSYTPKKGSALYPAAGTEDDYAYGVLGVPAYTFEMGANFFESCDYLESTVWPRNRDALLVAFRSARRPYESPSGPDSLDVGLAPDTAAPGSAVTLAAKADDTRYKYGSGEPTQTVAEARYSINVPSWAAGAITRPMAASDGSFNSSIENVRATIDTTGLSPGRHLVFVESRDASGSWGLASAAFLTVLGPMR